MKKFTPGGLLSLAKLGLRNYWFLIAWLVVCVTIFRCDYLHYKKAPQYYYLRRMLGLGVCISRGTAALVNVGIFLLVLPMGRSFLSLVRSFLPLWFNLFCDSFLPSSKTMHLVIAVTILLTSVAHSISHMANTINFSRHYIPSFPELNMASYKGESPVALIFTSVPGITGVSMLVILAIMGITSLKCVRTRQFEVFYYTHYSCVLFLIILLIHPLSGVLKGVLNVESHPPGCRFRTITTSDFNGANTFSSDFEGKEAKNQNKNLKDSLLSTLLAETTNVSERKGSHHSHGHPQSQSHGESKIPNQGPILLKASEQVLEYPKLSNGESEYFEEVFGYPEPESEPFDEVFGYPEPFDDLEYPDLATSIQRTASEEVIFNNRLHAKSGISVMPQENSDHLRHGTKRNRKYCMKPPLFVTIESKTWLWVLMTLLYLFIDCIIKHWRGQQEVEVLRVREFPANVLELTLRKQGFRCNPGQFILLRCPKASRYQWHPFTVAQCPSSKSESFTVLIRTKGNWCKKLREQVYLSVLKAEQRSKLPLQSHSHEMQKAFPEIGQIYVNNHSFWTNPYYEANADSESHDSAPRQKQEILNNHRELYCLSPVSRHGSGREIDADARNKILNTLPPSFPKEVSKNGLSKCQLATFKKKMSKASAEPCQCSSLNKYFLSQLPNQSYLEKIPRASENAEHSNLPGKRSSSYSTERGLDHFPVSLDNAFQKGQRLFDSSDPKDYKSRPTDGRYDRINHKPNQRSCSLSHNWNQSLSGHNTTSCSVGNYESNNCSFMCRDLKRNELVHHSSNSHSLRYHDVYNLNPSHKLTQTVEATRTNKGSEPDWSKLGVLEGISTSPPPVGSLITSENSEPQKYSSNTPHEGNEGKEYCPYIIDIERTQHLQSFRLFFDGPFNSPNEAVFSYPVVIGIVGGIGVTPLLASLSNLRNCWQPHPRRLHVVWVLRELQLILPLAPFFQSLIELFWTRKQEDRLELRFHCTGSVSDHDFISLLQNQYPFLKARLHKERPNWNDLFGVWKEAYRKCMVGVFCCGPKSLNREIRNYTLEALGEGFNFNYHHESFS